MMTNVDLLLGHSGTIMLRNGKCFYAPWIEHDQDRPGCFNFRDNQCGPNFHNKRDGTNYFPDIDPLWEVIMFVPHDLRSQDDIDHALENVKELRECGPGGATGATSEAASE